MNTRSLVACVAAASLCLSGCAFMNEEDREFYGKGWMHPSDLDREAPVHRIADPSHPEYSNATPATSAPQPPPEFIVPQTAQNPTGTRD